VLRRGERDANLVRLAKRLHRYPINGRRRSLRDVSKALAGVGYLGSSGKPYGAAAIARMVERKQPGERASGPRAELGPGAMRELDAGRLEGALDGSRVGNRQG